MSRHRTRSPSLHVTGAYAPSANDPDRRQWLAQAGCLAGWAAWGALAPAGAAPVPPRADSPRVGVDPIFVRTGLTDRWRAAMGRDLGWQAQWQEMDTPTVLSQLEAGQIDVGLFLSHPKADDLDKQGLIYNRQQVGSTAVWLVGPPEDLAGIRGERDPGRALTQVLLAARAGAAAWVAPAPQSPLAALADQLTRGTMPKLPRDERTHVQPPGPAYELVTRVQRARSDHRKIWLQDDTRLVLQAQVACSFRSRHPGGKLLVTWLGWPLAQQALRQSPAGWQGHAIGNGPSAAELRAVQGRP